MTDLVKSDSQTVQLIVYTWQKTQNSSRIIHCSACNKHLGFFIFNWQSHSLQLLITYKQAVLGYFEQLGARMYSYSQNN